MALNNFVLPSINTSIGLPAENPLVHLSSLDNQCQILRKHVEVSSLRYSRTANAARSNSSYSPSVTRCLKGVAFPQPDVIEKLISGGIIPSQLAPQTRQITRKNFPLDFKFGCSTSALQTEGPGTEGGRGPSTWDIFIGTNEIAVDSYNRYKEDVQLLKEMGADTYRFSISWSRILPDGTVSGGVNQAGIDFYNNFIDELINNVEELQLTKFPSNTQRRDNSICDAFPL